MRWNSKISWLGQLLLIMLSVTFVYWTVISIHRDEPAAAAKAILEGRPQWKAYQSRVLGPILIYVLSIITNLSFHDSYRLFLFLALLLNAVLVQRVIRKSSNDSLLGLHFALCNLYVFSFLQWFSTQLYVWDLIDITTSFMFVYGVFFSRNTRFFVLLFVVELFNRESAILVALWPAIRALGYRRVSGTRLTHSVLASSGMLLAQLLIYHILREFLANADVRWSFPEIPTFAGQQLQLPTNIFILRYQFFEVTTIIGITFLALLILSFVYYRFKKANDSTNDNMGLLLPLITVPFLVFAKINELRVWIFATPFLLFCLFSRRLRYCV